MVLFSVSQAGQYTIQFGPLSDDCHIDADMTAVVVKLNLFWHLLFHKVEVRETRKFVRFIIFYIYYNVTHTLYLSYGCYS